jgi:hypothetical protein
VLAERLAPAEAPPAECRFVELEMGQLERAGDDLLARLRTEAGDERALQEEALRLAQELDQLAQQQHGDQEAKTVDALSELTRNVLPDLVLALNSLNERHTAAK